MGLEIPEDSSGGFIFAFPRWVLLCFSFLGELHGAYLLGHVKNTAVINCVGVCGGDNAPEFVFGVGLVVAYLEEERGESLSNIKDVVMGGISRDCDKGLSGLLQLEGELFGRHGASEKSMAVSVGLLVEAAVAEMVFWRRRRGQGWQRGQCWQRTAACVPCP